MIKTILTVLTMIATTMLIGCATVSPNVYEPYKLHTVSSWQLAFAYESGEIEESQKSSGDAEVKVVSRGQAPQDLQLRDDLFYALRDDFGIPLVKKPGDAVGKITLHAIHFNSGPFKLLTVTFLDSDGETLARVKITNGDRHATVMDDEDFTRYAARAIVRVLERPQSQQTRSGGRWGSGASP